MRTLCKLIPGNLHMVINSHGSNVLIQIWYSPQSSQDQGDSQGNCDCDRRCRQEQKALIGFNWLPGSDQQ